MGNSSRSVVAGRLHPIGVVVAVALAILVGSCGVEPTTQAADPSNTTTSAPSTTNAPSTSSSTPTPTGADPNQPDPTAMRLLGRLAVDDDPRAPVPYDRTDWPHWVDLDGDGCDARQRALIDAAIGPVQMDPIRCTVVAGDWRSDYDGIELDHPSDLDVDHIVPLENAHRTGGWRWEAPRRRTFANDQANLWPVSASSNRSKSNRTPDEWRPPREEAWCTFARRWVTVKYAWELSITTSERDALGQMLDTCTPDG